MEIKGARAWTMEQRSNAPDVWMPKTDTLYNPEPPADPEARDAVSRLPGIATQLIGERMRSMYAAMVREPIPDDLLNLVRQLKAKEEAE